MNICDTLLYHAVFIYRNLSGNQNKQTSSALQETGVATRRNTLYNILPETFTKKDYDAAVLALGENGSTAAKWIEAFINIGRFFEWPVCVLVSLKPMRQAAQLPTQNTQKININKQYEYRK